MSEAAAAHAAELSEATESHATAAEAWARAPGRGVRGCRIGIMRAEMEAADTAVRNACLEALRALESEGAVLVDVDVALSEHALAVGVLSIATETMAGLIDDYRAHGRQMGGDLQLLLFTSSRFACHPSEGRG